MCGIVGAVTVRGSAGFAGGGIRDAVTALAHRGPDHSDVYEGDGVALGHTRLSIIDVPGGGQPMANEDGSVILVYNGEIWNYRVLRQELERLGHRFRSRSDTEVIVHGYEEWGDDLVSHLDGMFAFAIWDGPRERLLLARDRLGKKPLYLRQTARGVVFGSDARSVLLVSGERPEIAVENVAQYLFQRYVVAPGTLFAGIERLPPAHLAVFDRERLRVERYWQLDAPVEPVELSAEELRGLLAAATKRRLMSDVPVGVLLSGGIDSSAVLALARESGADSLATFTVGFDDPAYDERERARRIASHYATEHHELVVGVEDFLETWPRLAWYRDEAIAEASEIPLLLLSEFAGRHVRVALSGDGGDEVFGGYPKYRADAVLRLGGRPAATVLRAAVGVLARRRTHRQLERAAGTLTISDPLRRWLSWFRTMEPGAIEGLLAPPLAEEFVARLEDQLAGLLAPYGDLDAGRRMLLGDLFTYLPENMLLRSDKVLMAGSLEGRMPLLDLEVVRRATAAPASARSSLLQPKKVLREATSAIVPAELLGGPKRGFPVPVEGLLAAGGDALIAQLLLSERALSRGLFRPDALRRAVAGHPSERVGGRGLFVLACLELWARVNVDRVTTEPPSWDEIFAP